MPTKKSAEAAKAVEVTAEAPVVAAAPVEEKKVEEKPARKAAAKKESAEKKTAAAPVETVLVQANNGNEADVASLVEAAKAAFKAEKSRTAIKDLKLYVKPEEGKAYYVVNGEFTGEVNF